MGIILRIASILGVFFRELFPAIMREFKKPTETHYVGSDPTVSEAIGNSITRDAIDDVSIRETAKVELGIEVDENGEAHARSDQSRLT